MYRSTSNEHTHNAAVTGKQHIIELYQCDEHILDDIKAVEAIMLQAAEASGATVVAHKFHQFAPQGVSGAVIVAESHLAIHTWPEYNYCSVDIFTCGDHTDNLAALQVLKRALNSQSHTFVEVQMRKNTHTQATGKPEGDIIVKEPHIFKERAGVNGNIRKAINVQALLVHYQSKYQEIEVYQTDSLGKMLVIDGEVMLTDYDHYAYHEMITHVPLCAHPNPQRVLVVGGGDGGTATEILKHPSIQEVVVCEIDKDVVHMCQEHFPTLTNAFNDPRVRLHYQDAAEYIQTKKNYFDIVIVDSSDFIGPAAVLYQPEFFTNLHQLLTDDGIAVFQCESIFYERAFLLELIEQNKDLFAVVKPYYAVVPSYPSGMHSLLYFSKHYEPLDVFNATRAASLPDLQYYHPGMHQASFQVPRFLQESLQYQPQQTIVRGKDYET